MHEYAKFVLKDCLKLESGQPLLIVGSSVILDFMTVLKEEAKYLGCDDVAFHVDSLFEQRELLLNSTLEDILSSPLFDRHLYDEYAEKGGAFLKLVSPIPNINAGVSSTILKEVQLELEKRVSVMRKMQENGTLPWCIIAVPNEYWAKSIFPDYEHALDELWNVVLDICMISFEDPGTYWEEYFVKLDERCQILNNAQIRSLHYCSSSGTDLTLELPEDYLFASAKDSKWIVNMPSLEMFTTPLKTGVNGIVYSSKPLLYCGVFIDDFWLRFQDGRVVEAHASVGNEMLHEMIESDEGSHYLGEVSFVDYDSKINQSGILFQETLFDENACCHLALGRGFAECFRDGYSLSQETLMEKGMNVSKIHTDFMVGTRDLEITATLKNGHLMKIMEHGNLVI